MTSMSDTKAWFRDVSQLPRYRELLRNLVAKELKLKYRGAVLGILWSLISPLLMIIVYSVAFSYIIRIPLQNYPLFLVIGFIHWSLFTNSMLAATDAVLGNASLVEKIRFPYIILPISTISFQVIQFLLTFGVFIIAFNPLGGQFWLGMSIYPVILVLQIIFIVGLATGISALTVFYRDLKHLVDVGLMLLFWLTPIIYNFTLIPEPAQILFRLNPMVPFVIAYQDIFYLNNWPSPANWLLMIIWPVAALVFGYSTFHFRQHRFAEAL